jgi:hypothetical protein
MNINTKTKYEIQNILRELMQLTGKKHKLVSRRRIGLEGAVGAGRVRGGLLRCYRKIYPLDDTADYDRFLALTQKQCEDWTGASIPIIVAIICEIIRTPIRNFKEYL